MISLIEIDYSQSVVLQNFEKKFKTTNELLALPFASLEEEAKRNALKKISDSKKYLIKFANNNFKKILNSPNYEDVFTEFRSLFNRLIHVQKHHTVNPELILSWEADRKLDEIKKLFFTSVESLADTNIESEASLSSLLAENLKQSRSLQKLSRTSIEEFNAKFGISTPAIVLRANIDLGTEDENGIEPNIKDPIESEAQNSTTLSGNGDLFPEDVYALSDISMNLKNILRKLEVRFKLLDNLLAQPLDFSEDVSQKTLSKINKYKKDLRYFFEKNGNEIITAPNSKNIFIKFKSLYQGLTLFQEKHSSRLIQIKNWYDDEKLASIHSLFASHFPADGDAYIEKVVLEPSQSFEESSPQYQKKLKPKKIKGKIEPISLQIQHPFQKRLREISKLTDEFRERALKYPKRKTDTLSQEFRDQLNPLIGNVLTSPSPSMDSEESFQEPVVIKAPVHTRSGRKIIFKKYEGFSVDIDG